MATTVNSSINAVPPYQPLSGPPVDQETGELEMTLVQNPEQARAIWNAMWLADAPERWQRANVQAMLDGRPPNNPAKMQLNGLAGCCNVNWRDGALALQQAEAPYVDLINSVPFFLNIITKFGSEEDKLEWQQIMSEEFGFMLRSWESFNDRQLRLINYFLAHGVSMAFWNNDTDWRWDTGTLGDFCLPRLVTADVASIPYMGKRQGYPCNQLYDYIKDATPEERKGWYNGWHCPTVIQAIKNAAPKPFYRINDWELNEQLWKSSEIYWYLSAVEVSCILLWVRELDGTVSQIIVSEDSLLNIPLTGAPIPTALVDNFLYKRMNHQPRMDRCLVVFKNGVGTNGMLHSIRGLGNAIQPMVQALNAMTCRQMDAVNVELSIPIQAPEDVLNDEMAVQFAGPFMPIMEGVTVVNMTPRNYSNSVFPLSNLLSQKLNDQKGVYAGEGAFGGGEQTKFEIQARLEQSAGLRGSESNLFYDSFQRLLREALRRTVKIKSSIQQGGAAAFDWRERCMAKGVPPEALNQIDIERCLVVRALGNGSPAARMAALAAIEPLVPQFDEQGRRNYVRDRIAAQPGCGYWTADSYMPKAPDMRPSQQVRNAEQENIDMTKLGETMPVYPNDNHVVHLQQHVAKMQEISDAVDQGQMELEESVQPLSLLYQHSFEHLQMAGNDPINQREINFYRKAMQQFQEKIVNGSRKIEAQQRKAQEQQQEYQGPEGTDPQTLLEIEKQGQELYQQRKDLEFAEQSHRMKMAQEAQKLQFKQQEMNQKLAINDTLGAMRVVDQTQKIRQNARNSRKQ